MRREDIEELALKYQQKADKAFQNYQETGMTRYDREHRNNEDLAEALRMAARAADDSHRLTDLRVTLSEYGYKASQIADHGTEADAMKLCRELASSARVRGLIR